MLYWNLYKGHKSDIKGKRKFYDNNIYTFDIETSSYIILDDKIYPAIHYDKLSDIEKKRCFKRSHMYIWMFGINDIVYYGRTWDELKLFLKKLDNCISDTKYVFIHNLAFEFQYLKSNFHFEEVAARKSHKVITAIMKDYNIILRCSYMMTNVALKYLPKVFDLPVEKKVGDLDYSLIRNPNTPLTENELGYCEYDCLVLYHYILKELDVYEDVKHIPTTSTGKVRRELQELVRTDFKYRRIVHKAINTDPHIYNLLCDAFLGGYTHANWIYADEVLKNVDSYDIASSYPYVLATQKYPNSEFRKCFIKKREQMSKGLCYLLVVKFKNVKCRYYNNFISASKCRNLRGAKYDNGRLISADEFEMTLTDVDFYFYLDTYDLEYEIIECFYSSKNYLPKTLIKFILDKYVGKTELKGVEGKEMEYGRIKSMYNSIYGMSVTNNIRDNVIYYDNDGTWEEVELTNEEIIEKLKNEKKKSFLSFAYGVWVTAYARDNLLRRVIANDDYVVYCDTDSCKLVEGYDKEVFNNYNKSVDERIEYVCRILKLEKNQYEPKDIKGNKHMMGLFEKECNYEEFITQGAKKYAYKIDDKIHITIAGVPKKGASALKSLNDFRDNFIFRYEDTEKNLLMYVDNQESVEVEDYLGLRYNITDKSGCCILPNTYELSKSLDYVSLISDDSSRRAKYKEV